MNAEMAADSTLHQHRYWVDRGAFAILGKLRRSSRNAELEGKDPC